MTVIADAMLKVPLEALADGTDLQLLAQAEGDLIRLALDLGACDVGGPLTKEERHIVSAAARRPKTDQSLLALVQRAIGNGADPLGRSLAVHRSPTERRQRGSVYTPPALVEPMVRWILDQRPDVVVDAGAGTGRFSTAIATSPSAPSLIAVEVDPVSSLIMRGALATLRATHATVLQTDFMRLRLPAVGGRTAFVGNPPYVRHHDISSAGKAWARATARRLGHKISGLAGMHAHFFLAAALHGREGDVGCFVTSAEWLDVNYGAIVRELLLGRLGGSSVHFLEPTATPFEDANTTAAITCFQIGTQPKSVRLRRVRRLDDISPLRGGRAVARERLSAATRWTTLVRSGGKAPEGYVELGELCRVHRGAVTGSNAVWITDPDDRSLPAEVLFPAVTKARELFAAGTALQSASKLRRVIDLPEDLDLLDGESRRLVESFLQKARRAGIPHGYIAKYRRAWWSVGLKAPAPILATYMARRPPAFVRNLVEARHINIAHGIYPRVDLPSRALDRLAAALRSSVSTTQGRTYAGGLTKFEPREMERIPVPDLPFLLAAE